MAISILIKAETNAFKGKKKRSQIDFWHWEFGPMFNTISPHYSFFPSSLLLSQVDGRSN